MDNKEVLVVVGKKVCKIFDKYILDMEGGNFSIGLDYKDGRGYAMFFRNAEFGKIYDIHNKNLYINKKNYVKIGFLLNKYVDFLKQKEHNSKIGSTERIFHHPV